ncbi:MAG: lipase maturation factor family protein, partial [Myxococcales bacterium]
LLPGLASTGPPTSVRRWALRLLLFKVMFLSGYVKLASGDETWRSLTAMAYHYWTQPLPNAVSWYMHQLPLLAQKASAAAMFGIELALPFLVLVPRTPRYVAFGGLAALQLGIALTGNYGFFNLLSLVLCTVLLDDRPLASVLPRALSAGSGEDVPARGRESLVRIVGAGAAAGAAALSLIPLAATLSRPRLPQGLAKVRAQLSPLNTFNSYGLFAVMTTERPEIVVEGSADGETWKPYGFHYKPTAPEERPKLVPPGHMPRLDWQMWFAALAGHCGSARWYLGFAKRLLENERTVTRLLEVNPFTDAPPRYLRSTLYQYRFTTREQRRATGAWWTRTRVGRFCPTLTLVDGELGVLPE